MRSTFGQPHQSTSKKLNEKIKKCEFDKAENNQKGIILKDVTKDCKDKNFHTFEHSCEYDIKFQHASSGKVFRFSINNTFKASSSQTERLFRKSDEYDKDGYKFNEKIKLTLKIKSLLS